MANEHLVVVVGGAVAGSEAVLQLREKGITVICIEQNPLPFGKIEDGLPRWHVEQRKKEYEKIVDRLNHPAVHFVPSTRLGKDISFDELYKEWKPSAVLLASGAWKDRPLGLDGVDQYVDKGLVYQNPLVYWFNHYWEPKYRGQTYEIPDPTIIIGGGLASLDVVKICQIEIAQKMLKKRGISVEMLSLEKEGIPAILAQHKLTWSDLKVQPTTIYYRRRVQDMPLADMPDNATPEQETKVGGLRTKILNNYKTKFLFEMKECHLPKAPIVENGRLAGLTFLRTQIEGKKVVQILGSETEVRANMIISSIGSIPDLVAGIPVKSETYDVRTLDTGEINGMPGLYALGNAVTGKGNIRVSMMHGRQVGQHVAEKLTAGGPTISADTVERIMKKTKELQTRAGYDGNLKGWVEKNFSAR